jgi:hypothetical protein
MKTQGVILAQLMINQEKVRLPEPFGSVYPLYF